MAKIIKAPITKVERLIFKSPVLEKDHDFKAEYNCSCGKPLAYYHIGRPDILLRCFDCTFS